jgi:dihydrolipoamide dehydrogenase
MIYDCVVIGGGPSGSVAAARIGQLGGKVCLIEKEFLGGVCTNWGCIPTKAMIASAKVVYENKEAEKLGIYTSTRVDFKKVVIHRDNEIAKSRSAMKELLQKFKVEVVYGEGKIIDKTTVSVNNEKLKTRNIILCTGSKATYPHFIRLSDRVLTSKELTSINVLPRNLAIMGGGVIGCEFATIFRNLGSDVTIIERFDRLVFNEDKEIGEKLAEEFTKMGIKLMLGCSVKDVNDRDIITEKGVVPYDYCLIATGRSPLLDEETLKKLWIDYDKTGVKVNDRMQTTVKNIYCIGDATGKSILAHVGVMQATVAANNIMGKGGKMNYTVPRCVYSIPEIACVGKTELECKNPKTATIQLKNNARATLEGKDTGFVKVIMEKNKIVGFQMIGHNVTEIVNEAALIVKNNISPKDIMSTIHPHPTLGETIKYAVQKAMGELCEIAD